MNLFQTVGCNVCFETHVTVFRHEVQNIILLCGNTVVLLRWSDVRTSDSYKSHDNGSVLKGFSAPRDSNFLFFLFIV